jgi:hypothetical protein
MTQAFSELEMYREFELVLNRHRQGNRHLLETPMNAYDPPPHGPTQIRPPALPFPEWYNRDPDAPPLQMTPDNVTGQAPAVLGEPEEEPEQEIDPRIYSHMNQQNLLHEYDLDYELEHEQNENQQHEQEEYEQTQGRYEQEQQEEDERQLAEYQKQQQEEDERQEEYEHTQGQYEQQQQEEDERQYQEYLQQQSELDNQPKISETDPQQKSWYHFW